MAIVLEKEGKTVSEATISACEELGVSRNEVDIEVIQESSKGVLGIGSKNAIVKVTVKNEKLSEKGLKSKKALESILEYAPLLDMANHLRKFCIHVHRLH